ncbi:MAG: hypothetical protein U1E53_09005 [Dongiaceae bacterium]
MADLDAAVRLLPKDSNAHLDRGIALAYGGDLAGAEREIAAAQELAPADAYAAIWLVIVQRRRGASGEVDAVSGKVDRAAWPGPVLELLAGRMTQDQLLAAAADPCRARSGAGSARRSSTAPPCCCNRASRRRPRPLLEAADAGCRATSPNGTPRAPS